MSYQYGGKDRYVPAGEEETEAKFAYFRKAEAGINGGPAPIYAEPAQLPVRQNRKQPVCGTPSGYKRHLADGIDPCRKCLDARAVYQRDYRARRAMNGPIAGPYGTKPGPKPKPLGTFDPALCGTMVGWRQHRKHGQERCRECKQAHNEYHAEWQASKLAEAA